MANAKNTIQNIPLTGNLNLNKLKTDVSSFEGYNEKNTTVFGGELTNIYTKETELGKKSETYTIFNSKGEPFTIKQNGVSPKLYIGDTLLDTRFSVPLIKDDYNIVDNTIWFAHVPLNMAYTTCFQLCFTSEGKLYGRFGSSAKSINSKPYIDLNFDWAPHTFNPENIVSMNANFFPIGLGANSRGILTFVYMEDYNDTEYAYYTYTLYDIDTWTLSSPDISKHITDRSTVSKYTNGEGLPFVTIAETIGNSIQNSKVFVCALPTSGKSDGNFYSSMLKISFDSQGNPTKENLSYKRYYYRDKATITAAEETAEEGFNTNYIILNSPHGGLDQYNSLHKYGSVYTQQSVEITPESSYLLFRSTDPSAGTLLYCPGKWLGFTGHDGNFYLPGIKKGGYLNGILYAKTFSGRLIDEPGVIKAPYYYIDSYSVTYKNADGKWIVYLPDSTSYLSEWEKYRDKIIIDNRYIMLYNYLVYDIEEKRLIKLSHDDGLGYLSWGIPYVSWSDNNTHPSSYTGLIYGDGENVQYPITKVPFTGLLMNPNVMTKFPVPSIGRIETFQGTLNYYSIGDTVQSAKYQGDEVEFIGTSYPIDVNGNIIYPITWNSSTIKGYSNNSLIQNGNTTYPLIYWSPNQNIYAYYAFSAMSNVKGAFALQGQQYTFDNSNIYNVQFSNGIIQSSNSVCYIENMEFLGTLPTSAIFYSKYNKTFYKFTGDNILTKMFEANDIDEIRMVGQNPSTLSLWISTDKGIYVLSDTDMFKLNYIPENIYFNNEKTILVNNGETNWIEDDISLYDIENGGTPSRIKFKTKYYGLGGEHKALYDCWYIRLHSDEKREGKIAVKMNTITDTSFASNTETKYIEKSMYDENNQIYLKFQPKYQSGVAVQLELESDIPVYQISLGANVTDQVTQQAKFNF